MDEIEDQLSEDDSPERFAAKLRAAFKDEAYELLAELEYSLLELEKKPSDMELIGRAFRAMHTIKGSGGACEFHDIVAFTHDLETIFDKIRNNKVVANQPIIDLALTAKDQIKSIFDSYYHGGSVDELRSREILAALKILVPDSSAQAKKILPSPKAAIQEEQKTQLVTYRIRFRPNPQIFLQGNNPLHLLDELRELGPCQVVAQTDAMPCLEDIDPQACYTYWDVIMTTNRGMNAIQDIFLFVRDSSELIISVINESGFIDDEVAYKKLGEILLERGDVTNEDLQKALNSKKKVGEVLIDTGVVAPAKVESALAEQEHVREIREHRKDTEAASSIRVSTEKLDDLVNLVGELVTVQSQLSQLAFTQNSTHLLSVAEEVERLTGELRDKTMSMRMLPIGTTFSRFKRLVRDLSFELDKEIELATEGAETELDKTVIERLNDPLIHLIRNSIDHGIEKPEARESSGKSRTGTIRLSAAHAGAHVLIRIQDDGAGLNKEAIHSKAVEKGLISKDAELSDRELFPLVLTPGFSTATSVTDVSGRGVGLDVVKRTIDDLQGTLEIESEQGKGTAITLKLPLTLAIIDGFLTKIGEEHFILPLSLVEECVELTRKQAANGHGRHLINVRGHVIPYVRLREQFHVGGEQPHVEQIVITRVEDKRIGFVVDHIVGGHQTVIKNLGKFYRNVDGVSGATILGDGTVALVLDVPKLVQSAVLDEQQRMEHANSRE